jgi:peptidoglycan/xylan/chitin deacetylase (PgdA/CDA1 family)
LASGGLVEIGAHTLTHPTLPPQPLEIQRAEIFQSKAACETLSGRKVISFSYPFGDSVPATAELVREAGFTSACSAGRVNRGTERFRLPRLTVQDWDGAELERRMALALNRW